MVIKSNPGGTILPGYSFKGGVLIMPVNEPLDFKEYEVFVSLTPNFIPTGWDPNVYNPIYKGYSGYTSGSWVTNPNAPGEWNGTDKNLHTISATAPINVHQFLPGTKIYMIAVRVDKSNQRSIPSAIVEGVCGGPPKSSTVVIAAADASPASKAGADYVCTGTSDQTIINQAINETVAANPNTSVLIKGTEGNYNVDGSILLPSNVTFDFTGTFFVNGDPNRGFWVITNSDTVNGNENITIKNVIIDGNKSSRNVGNNGISLSKVNKSIIDKVKVKNILGSGIYCYNSNVAIQGVEAFNNLEGIYVCGSNDQAEAYSKIVNCRAHDNLTGFKLSFINKGCVMNDSYSYNNRVGAEIDHLSNAQVSNNNIYLSQRDGVTIWESCNNAITGNQIHSNSQEATNYYSNIMLYSSNYGCDNNTIQGNTCRVGDQTNKPKYGIRIDSPECENNLVTGNDCVNGGLVAGISDAGTNTNFGSGNRTNDGKWRQSMIIGKDSFDRANSTTTLGNAETGQAWSYPVGTWGIQSNKAFVVAGSSPRAIINSGVSDCVISWAIGVVAANMRFLFRYSDTSNEWFLHTDVANSCYILYKRVGGTSTAMGTFPLLPEAGQIVKVTLNGPQIGVFINDTQYLDLSDTHNQTATKHGLTAVGVSLARWDDFLVEAV